LLTLKHLNGTYGHNTYTEVEKDIALQKIRLNTLIEQSLATDHEIVLNTPIKQTTMEKKNISNLRA